MNIENYETKIAWAELKRSDLERTIPVPYTWCLVRKVANIFTVAKVGACGGKKAFKV